MARDTVVLSEGQRVELSSIAQSRSLPAGYVFRANLILMPARGASYNSIKVRLGTTAPTKPILWKYSDPNRRIRSNELTATGH